MSSCLAQAKCLYPNKKGMGDLCTRVFCWFFFFFCGGMRSLMLSCMGNSTDTIVYGLGRWGKGSLQMDGFGVLLFFFFPTSSGLIIRFNILLYGMGGMVSSSMFSWRHQCHV